METAYLPSNPPRLSVIVASYNAGGLLEDCLKSLENQKTDKSFEIIVFDSSSNSLGRQIKDQFPRIRLFQFEERKFCGEARNVGLSVAKGEIIAFIDADCRADQNWVAQILKAHQSPTLAIGGAIANGNPKSAVGWAAYFCDFSQWMPRSPFRLLRDIAGANMSYKKKTFEAYGLLLTGTYASDTDFHWRLVKDGNYLQFDPSILVFHQNIDKCLKFLKHEFEHGQSFARIRMRSQPFSKWRRGLYGAFSFLIPALLFLRVVLRNIRNRIYLSQFIKSVPLLILGLTSWSLGEAFGYLKGENLSVSNVGVEERVKPCHGKGKQIG